GTSPSHYSYPLKILIASNRSRPPEDDGCACQRHEHAEGVPAVGRLAFHCPQPHDGRGDVNAAVGGIGSPGEIRLHAGEGIGEEGEARHAGRQPPCALAQPEPRPEGEAACNLADRRNDVPADGGHRLSPQAQTAHRNRVGRRIALEKARKQQKPPEGGLLWFPSPWEETGAGEEIRTLDPNLGKVVLYP